MEGRERGRAMTANEHCEALQRALSAFPRVPLAHLPTPMRRLPNFERHLPGLEIWIKRDDLTGLAGGGNKTRKLEFLVADALREGADTLVTAGAMQSNHTRQTAAAAARHGLKCALLHCAWTEDAGPHYRAVGNVLLSALMGADLYVDDTPRAIEGATSLDALVDHLRACGRRPYLVPPGASEHRLGSFGYAACAAEIVAQSQALDLRFDFVVHTTGSSSTQSGLLVGFTALKQQVRVVGVPDDAETAIKRQRVLQLANAALNELGFSDRLDLSAVEIVAGDTSPYGAADDRTIAAIRLLAQTEGLLADPVYEGKAVRGLLDLAARGRFPAGSRILLLHLGGSHAVHAYANRFGALPFKSFPG